MKLRSRITGRIIIVVATVALLLLAVGVALAATIIVDHFSSGAEFAFATVPCDGCTAVVSESVAAAASIGGRRSVVVTATGVGLNSAGFLNTWRVNTAGTGIGAMSSDTSVRGQVHIQWDGGTDPTTLNPNGLGGIDLTDGATNNAIVVVVTFDDLPVNIALKVYSGTNWSQRVIAVPGSIINSRVDFVLPFSSFTIGGGTGVNFNSVGAIVMDIDGTTSPGADLNLDTVEVTSTLDFGDLPNAYGTSLASNGPRHTSGALRLGPQVDSEPDGFPSANADGDNLNQSNDEDGVVRTPGVHWSTGTGGTVDFTVNGCVGTCFLHGWIDWGHNNNLTDAGDEVINRTVVNGTSTITFPIPGGTTFPANFYARFRICGGSGGSNDCTTPTGPSSAGEVEDYLWGFGPTAVSLDSVSAHAAQNGTVLIVLLALTVVGVCALGFAIIGRRRKAL